MKLKKKLKRGQKIAIKRIRTKFDIKKILHPTRHVNWEKKGGERKKKKGVRATLNYHHCHTPPHEEATSETISKTTRKATVGS
jgi:hypothetical protein